MFITNCQTVLSPFLLKFFVFCFLFGSAVAMGVSQSLPSSLYMASKFENEVSFHKYIVCRKCHKIYHMTECLDARTQTVKACSYIAFPSHPHQSVRRSCGCQLPKTVELANGRTYFYPFFDLQLCGPTSNFYNQCELWR